MRPLAGYELRKAVEKVSLYRMRKIREFIARAQALEVGEEMFHCFIKELPSVAELKKMLNTSEKSYQIWETINGVIVRRKE
jgi:hypothetical protein